MPARLTWRQLSSPAPKPIECKIKASLLRLVALQLLYSQDVGHVSPHHVGYVIHRHVIDAIKLL